MCLNIGLRPSHSRQRSIRLVDAKLLCTVTGLCSPSLWGHRNAQQHGQHQAGHLRQSTGLVGPGLAAELSASGVSQRDLQPGAALLLVQLGRPADALAERRAGSLRDGAQVGGGDGGHVGLEAGQGVGELLLRGVMAQALHGPGWCDHGESDRAIAR